MAQVESMASRLARIDDIPTLPTVLTKLEAAVNNPQSNATSIAAILHDDPAIMARILKVVNSAFYGIPGTEINSLEFAVTRMGMRAISNIALSTSVFSVFKKRSTRLLNMHEFWRHSICTGIAVNIVYNHCKRNLKKRYSKDLLHLAGLLHGIGKIILAQYFPEEFQQALEANADKLIPLKETEQDLLNCDHTMIGLWLGKKWNLAPELLQCVRWVEDPENSQEQFRDLVRLCHVGSYICSREKIGDNGELSTPALIPDTWKHLGLSVQDITEIVDLVKEDSAQSELLMTL